MLDDVFVTVKRSGSPLGDELMSALDSVVVEQSLTLPDMFVLTFLDEMRRLLAGGAGTFAIGEEITVELQASGLPGPKRLVKGEVTAVEAESDGTGVYTVVRGYDRAHRLQRGRKVRTFVNQSYADVVRKVLDEAAVPTGTIESGPTHPVVSQNNLTDWEFLQGLGREAGCFAGTLDGAFVFATPGDAGQAPPAGDLRSTNALQLTLGDELLRFRGVASAAEQVGSVVVRAWDPKRKEAVVATAQAGEARSTRVDSRVSPRRLGTVFGTATLTQVDVPDHLQAPADAAAEGLMHEIASVSAEFDGVARGHPDLRAGAAVSIGLVGAPFDGKYVLTTARHVVDSREGYTTAFAVTGLRDTTLYGLANGGLPAGAPPVHGVVVALVTNNKDPDKLLRVKLKFPWLADDYESDWARLVQLGAGAERGSVVVPEVNDEVLVAFDHGDLRRPYVLGGVYNGKDEPHLGPGGEAVAGDGSVNHRTVTSRTHQTVALVDERGKQAIVLVTGDGRQKLALEEADRRITVTSDGDIEVTAKGSGRMTMDATGDVKVTSKGNVAVEATGNVKVKATANLDLEGAMVNIKATGQLVLRGATVQIN